MPFLTLIAFIIVVGVGIFRANPEAKEEVAGAVNEATSSPSLSPIPATPKSSPTNKATINIKVDANVDGKTPTSVALIYPGASFVSGSTYQTNDSGSKVYEWYKNELGNRSYNIRTNVKTQANDKFKAVLAGASQTSSIKVTIDQENSSSSTTITLE